MTNKQNNTRDEQRSLGNSASINTRKPNGSGNTTPATESVSNNASNNTVKPTKK